MAQPAPADDPQISPDADEARRQAQCAQKWIAELGVSEKFQRKWLERAKKIAKRYKRDDRSPTDGTRKFAMLWANTQTIQPAVYSRPPVPVVTRRFADADPVARTASEVLERCLAYSVDVQDADSVLRQCSFDYVLYGRGQTWERYVPTYGPAVTSEIPLQVVTGPDADDDNPQYLDDQGQPYDGEVTQREGGQPYGQGQPYQPVVYEESITDYVNWEDFGHGPARTWDEVPYVWRRVYLSREQLIERFGKNLGQMIPLDWGPIEQGRGDAEARMQKKAAVYEIWDKASKRAYWISKSWNSRPLDERDDPLGLDGFFPCPKPCLGTTANDSVMPVPDYVYYQDQAEEIDKLTGRIGELQDALKVRGFYAGDSKSNINALMQAGNSQLIPVPDWLSLKENGGARGMVEWWPIDTVVVALNALIQQRQQLIADVQQITGVADIMRGMGDPRATATQEQMKGQWGTLRVRDRQIEMMRFARDGLRIKAGVIAGKFSAVTLKAMSGVDLPTNAMKQQAMAQIQQAQMQAQLMAQRQQAMAAQQPLPAPGGPPAPGAAPAAPQTPPQAAPAPPAPPQPPQIPPEVQQMLATPSWEDVEALLQDPNSRCFRIDIETDSTIEPNEQAEKAALTEMLQALGNLVQQWGPVVQAQPALAPMVGEIIKFAMRKFRAGRSLEATVDQAVDGLVAQASQPKPQAPAQPPPAPIDPTKIAVAQINAQSERESQAAETQRTQIEAAVKGEEINQRAQDSFLKAVALPHDPTPQVQM